MTDNSSFMPGDIPELPKPSSEASPPSRLFMGACFVLATIVTALFSSWGSYLVSEAQTDRSEKIATISAFVESTQAFDRRVREFVDAFNENPQSAAEERIALQNNLLDQHVKLGAADDFLAGGALQRAKLYRLILEDIDAGIKEMKDAGSVTRFAQRVSDAVAERERLIADLRSAAGLRFERY